MSHPQCGSTAAFFPLFFAGFLFLYLNEHWPSLCKEGLGMGTEHLPGALCSGTGSPALGLCSP